MATVNMASALKAPSASQSKVLEMPVGDSSWIAKIKYDPAQLQLTVTTKEGSEYVHFMVYPATADQFMQAPSKGRYYAQQIKGKGLTTKVISKSTGPAERNPSRPKEAGRKRGR